MKHTVRLLTALLCLSLLIALCACDETTPVATTQNSETEQTAAPETSAPETDNTVTVPEGTQNALIVSCTSNADGTITATVSIAGEVCFAALAGDLNYDKSVLSPASSTPSLSGTVVNISNPGAVSFAYASISNVTTAQPIFSVTFDCIAETPVSLDFTLSVNPDNFSNASLENVAHQIFGASLTLD